MTSPETATELQFEPPGPGPWELETVHFPRPVTRYWTETHPEPFKRGFRDFTSFYGMLIDTMEYAYVNGFAYNQAQPVPEDEIPRRFQRAEEVFPGKVWREQLRDWDETVKPAAIKAHRELQSVDPDALSDEDLIAYLTRCREHHAAMISQHMRFTAAAVLPTGDFLAHVGDWTSVPPAELLGLMHGTAPVSAGASAELEQLIAAFEDDPDARALLESEDDPGQVLEALRSLEGDPGAAMSAYLDLVGYRLLDGFDISEPYALEMPDVLLRAIRVAVGGRGLEASDVDDRIADVRNNVPEEHRAEFDDLLEEARLTYRLRDERGVFSDIWASGLMRRAVLAGGRRLAATGRIHAATDLVYADFDEMRSLLSGADVTLRGRAGGAGRIPSLAQLEGRATAPGRPAPSTARPVRLAARGWTCHAGHRDLACPSVRQLRGGARGERAAGAGGKPGRVRRTGASRNWSLRVRPDRQGRRPRHPVDERGLQHPAAAARGHRDGQRRPALALGDRCA